jgi:hypothetical protein
MLQILIAAFSIACWRMPVVPETLIEEIVLANVVMETNEIAASAEAGDLLNANWNLMRGVEAGKLVVDNTGFGCSQAATISSQLETKIATGALAERFSGYFVHDIRCGVISRPSTLPPFDRYWLRSAVWPLTGSYMEQVIETHPIIGQNDRIEFNY